MAYDTSNPPKLVTGSPLTGAGQRWRYDSADAGAVVDGAGYFSNGDELGMKVGDTLEAYDSATGIVTQHVVNSVTAGGAADLGDGTVTGSGTDTD